MKSSAPVGSRWLLSASLFFSASLFAAESPYLYGIFGDDPNPSEYLGHIAPAGPGWVTATVQVGADTNDASGVDFTFLSNQGHTVICRINHGYFPNGTIPLVAKYDDFAKRCSNFVAHSAGCSIWTIGNELNIAGEWPVDFNINHSAYVTPSNYALCFRKVYNAIKAVQPNARVLPQAPACFAGPYAANSQSLTWLGTNYTHDANPLTWPNHLKQMLIAITNTGPVDGIALHVSSRGYNCSDVHSTATFSGAAAGLYNSFFVYKDWVNLGIPSTLYNLPLYATECNGYYFWKGGHPENIFAHYEAGWMQAVYAEINRYNENALMTGKPIFRCFNMYRWGPQDEWGIDRGDNLFKAQILSDLDVAVTEKYTWPGGTAQLRAPIGLNFMHPDATDDSVPVCEPAGVVPQRSWNNLTQGGTGTGISLGGSVTVTWSTPGGGTHGFGSVPTSPADYALAQGYLDTGDTSTTTATVSGLKFPLFDVIVYSMGDNGGATRVGKYTLSGSGITTVSKYVRDDGGAPDFSGTYTEADSTSGGAGAPSGNYCRFRNVRGASFAIAAKGDYASDAHPRAPLNAIQIVPINTVATLSDAARVAGQFQCYVNGATNVNYIVQYSTNLTSWISIRTNAAPFTFTDVAAGNSAFRFYRALFQ
ncbi:MAG: hypothetical protein EXS35_15350 [Pedosphaera sp.]|nr:hypothetical protein [Pedosphaera sp.]